MIDSIYKNYLTDNLVFTDEPVAGREMVTSGALGFSERVIPIILTIPIFVLGIDHDIGEFAVNGVRLWLDRRGRERYPAVTRLLITADGGGSNGSRLRLWKTALQKLADENGPHHPSASLCPGTSKWNKIEHRMFHHITQNCASWSLSN